MFKSTIRSIVVLAAMAFGLAACGMQEASAADVIKGKNQNGYNEVVPVAPISSYQHTGGKLYYRTQFSNTVFYIEDAASTQLTVIQTKLAGNLVASTTSGWTYNLKNTKITCAAPLGTIATPSGGPGSETIADNCALWQTANNL